MTFGAGSILGCSLDLDEGPFHSSSSRFLMIGTLRLYHNGLKVGKAFDFIFRSAEKGASFSPALILENGDVSVRSSSRTLKHLPTRYSCISFFSWLITGSIR